MKIHRVSLWKVPLTSHVPYHMADKSCVTVDTVVVRVDADDGTTGWGENCPIPHYLPAFAEGIAPAIEYMMPVVLGGDARAPEALMAKLDRHLLGHSYAKSPLDMAFWDIAARAAKVPLYQLLGGRQTADLPVYHSLTCIAPDAMAAMAAEAVASGITQIQIKLGADNDWRADVARVREVRAAAGDAALVYADWNCGSDKLTAIRVARAVADLDVMLEQPCASIAECAAVKRATGLPMKLDEAVRSPRDLLDAHAGDCLDAAALKISKFGGLSAARRARDLCVHLGVKMCVEDTWGSDIVTAAALHLATATDARCLMNVCDLSHYVAPRLDADAPVRCDGYIRASDSIGLGVSPDLDLLGEADAVWE